MKMNNDFGAMTAMQALRAYVAEMDGLRADGELTKLEELPAATTRLLLAALAMAMQQADREGQIGSNYTYEDACIQEMPEWVWPVLVGVRDGLA